MGGRGRSRCSEEACPACCVSGNAAWSSQDDSGRSRSRQLTEKLLVCALIFLPPEIIESTVRSANGGESNHPKRHASYVHVSRQALIHSCCCARHCLRMS